ncbi:MAG: hypothetical protein M3Y72_03485 [Acidobacteriota bacterium]|nr:hypothetical protein [Acidobacteriota bacterium]
MAGDSTMTGFSDLFKIPTGALQPRALGGWKRPSEILKPGVEAGGPVTGGPETSPSVAASILALDNGYFPAQSMAAGNSLSDTTQIETSLTKIAGPVLEPSATSPRVNPQTGGYETDPAETGPPVSRQSLPELFPAPLQRKLQIREAKLVQEGHTYGEQTVYEALWKYGVVVNEQVRVITIGFLRMANIAGLAESNCKAAVAGLLDKLTIERLPDKNIAQGRTYKVYNWTSVLARRKGAGLTHVIKSRGVIFVDPKTGRQLTAAKTLPRRQVKANGSETGGAEIGGPVSVGAGESDLRDRFSTLAETHRQSMAFPSLDQSPRAAAQERPSLQPEIRDLASRLRKDLDSAFDDSAAGRLWRECQKSVPDCTVDEVVHFVALKSQNIYRNRNIRNPIGLLLMSIPEFFTGTAVHELRAEKRREEEQRRESQVQQRKYWQEVADDPNTPSDERELALKFLAEIE